MSCSAEAIKKSFTCNDQNKEETCIELSNLHLDVQDRINTQCKQMLRGTQHQQWCSDQIRRGTVGYCAVANRDTSETYQIGYMTQGECIDCCKYWCEHYICQNGVYGLSYKGTCEASCGTLCDYGSSTAQQRAATGWWH